jgi:hypothetical protein
MASWRLLRPLSRVRYHGKRIKPVHKASCTAIPLFMPPQEWQLLHRLNSPRSALRLG